MTKVPTRAEASAERDALTEEAAARILEMAVDMQTLAEAERRPSEEVIGLDRIVYALCSALGITRGDAERLAENQNNRSSE